MSMERNPGKQPAGLISAVEALECISDGFFVIDRSWRLVYANRQACVIAGREPEHLIGRNFWEVFPQIPGTNLESEYRKAMDDNTLREFDFHDIPEGLWFHIRICPYSDGITACWQDVTVQKLTEEDLLLSYRNFMGIFNNSIVGLVYCQTVFDENNRAVDYRVLDINSVYERWVGFRRDQVIGKKITEIFPDLTGEFLDRHNQVALTGKEMHYEAIDPLAGEWYEVNVFSPQKGFFLVLFSNITRFKQTEEALARLNDELELNVNERTKELFQANEQLKVYSRRITQIQEEERKHIAYELHENIGQYLAVLKMELNSLLHSGNIKDARTLNKLNYLEKDTEKAIDDVQRYSHELRSRVLEHLRLQDALSQLAEDMKKSGRIQVQLAVTGFEPELPEDIKLGFFRIAQEAIDNCCKHSNELQAYINLEFTADFIKMTVIDKGVGFNSTRASSYLPDTFNLGLMSMRERAKIIGAHLTIDSQPGKGTSVIVELPLAPKEKPKIS